MSCFQSSGAKAGTEAGAVKPCTSAGNWPAQMRLSTPLAPCHSSHCAAPQHGRHAAEQMQLTKRASLTLLPSSVTRCSRVPS